MANLGYVGLGAMGGRMAERLIAKGHAVTGYNRTKAKAQWLIDLGMRWADTPRELAEVVRRDLRDGHRFRRRSRPWHRVPTVCSRDWGPARCSST